MIASIQSSYRHDTKNIIVAAQNLSLFQVTRAQSTAPRPRCGFVQLITASVVRTLARNATDQFSALPNSSPAGVDPAGKIALAI
jgi:hypothetical protein